MPWEKQEHETRETHIIKNQVMGIFIFIFFRKTRIFYCFIFYFLKMWRGWNSEGNFLKKYFKFIIDFLNLFLLVGGYFYFSPFSSRHSPASLGIPAPSFLFVNALERWSVYSQTSYIKLNSGKETSPIFIYTQEHVIQTWLTRINGVGSGRRWYHFERRRGSSWARHILKRVAIILANITFHRLSRYLYIQLFRHFFF